MDAECGAGLACSATHKFGVLAWVYRLCRVISVSCCDYVWRCDRRPREPAPAADGDTNRHDAACFCDGAVDVAAHHHGEMACGVGVPERYRNGAERAELSGDGA